MSARFTEFLRKFESKVIPLAREGALAYFDASVSGKSQDYQKAARLELEYRKIYASKADFDILKSIKENEQMDDEILNRQLHILYNDFLANQVEETRLQKMVELQNINEEKFATFRVELNGRRITDNQVDEILRDSIDSARLKAAWEGSKKIGAIVSMDVLELVKLRNQVANDNGFSNYHAMSLELSEQSPQEMDNLFDELDDLTRNAYEKVKQKIDEKLAQRLEIDIKDLQAWHFQDRFFQHAPQVFGLNLDEFYEGRNIENLTARYYKSIGFPIEDLLKNSDLYEKAGKYQHAYCTDIDRNGDVRVLCNIQPNANWMGTMLHEFGHAVYDKYIDRKLPWLLRSHAHVFTTEAVAMLFGRFAFQPDFLNTVVQVPASKTNKIEAIVNKFISADALVFSRWAQVMYRFEKQMYENPDQNLDDLWWAMVENYQLIKRPASKTTNHWASKIHLALYPAYYHNYFLGELLAAQLLQFISVEILKNRNWKTGTFFNRPETGEFLREKFFKPGSRLPWNELIQKTTGQELSARSFAEQFVI